MTLRAGEYRIVDRTPSHATHASLEAIVGRHSPEKVRELKIVTRLLGDEMQAHLKRFSSVIAATAPHWELARPNKAALTGEPKAVANQAGDPLALFKSQLSKVAQERERPDPLALFKSQLSKLAQDRERPDPLALFKSQLAEAAKKHT